MADIITTLTIRRTALLRRKEKIQANATKQIKEIDKELQDTQNALDAVNKAVSSILCPDCGGTGTTKDAPCAICHGTGVILQG